jgi:plastocyanin
MKEGNMAEKPVVSVKPVTHTVKVKVDGRKVTCEKPIVIAYRGEEIEWMIDEKQPFAVVVKAHHSPLQWAAHAAPGAGKPLVVKVRKDAVPGYYPYALCVCAGSTIVVVDPEIIIPPPKGGRP